MGKGGLKECNEFHEAFHAKFKCIKYGNLMSSLIFKSQITFDRISFTLKFQN